MTEQPYRIFLKRIEYGYVVIDSATSKEDAIRQYEDGNFDEVYFEEGWERHDEWDNPRLEDVYPEVEYQN